MRELASRGQLRNALLRWTLVAVPLVLLLGMGAVRLAGADGGNRWYAALEKPALAPPGGLLPLLLAAVFALMGGALAIVLNARGARGRGLAIALFAVLLALLLAWIPLFFAAHQVGTALWVMGLALAIALLLLWCFARIRRLAGVLLLPCVLALALALFLGWAIGQMNPGAETLVPGSVKTQILL